MRHLSFFVLSILNLIEQRNLIFEYQVWGEILNYNEEENEGLIVYRPECILDEQNEYLKIQTLAYTLSNGNTQEMNRLLNDISFVEFYEIFAISNAINFCENKNYAEKNKT
jgi:hypothetical protein